jgi:hypothetical protein
LKGLPDDVKGIYLVGVVIRKDVAYSVFTELLFREVLADLALGLMVALEDGLGIGEGIFVVGYILLDWSYILESTKSMESYSEAFGWNWKVS